MTGVFFDGGWGLRGGRLGGFFVDTLEDDFFAAILDDECFTAIFEDAFTLAAILWDPSFATAVL